MFRSLVYDTPHLYDLVFPDAEGTVGMVLAATARHLPAAPRSMLDVGCGTGQHLEALARIIPECLGVDLLESNVAYARSRRPGIEFRVGDMRAVRLGRTFDLLTCLGNALSYALTDRDLADALRTLAVHARPGALLIVDPLNARAYLEGDGFRERIEATVETPGFTATAVSIHALDRAARILRRTRTWRVSGGSEVETDHAEYRLLFPEEIRGALEAAGFGVLDMYDNRDLEPSDLTGRTPAAPDAGGMRGRKLYVFARRAADHGSERPAAGHGPPTR